MSARAAPAAPIRAIRAGSKSRLKVIEYLLEEGGEIID
jgi:hypothetical protein